MNSKWEECIVYYREDYGPYTQISQNRFCPLDIFDIFKIKTKKKAGDWGQVESCFSPSGKPRKIFVTADKMAAAYAVSRGVPIMYNSDKTNLFVKEHSDSKKETLMAVSFILSKPTSVVYTGE